MKALTLAWSVSGDRQCPKHAAVALSAAYVTPGPSPETFQVHVGAGHFDVHRTAKPLGIVV